MYRRLSTPPKKAWQNNTILYIRQGYGQAFFGAGVCDPGQGKRQSNSERTVRNRTKDRAKSDQRENEPKLEKEPRN